jgi:hypothetical protein
MDTVKAHRKMPVPPLPRGVKGHKYSIFIDSEGRAHVDADLGDGLRAAAVDGQIGGERGHGAGVLARSDEQ